MEQKIVIENISEHPQEITLALRQGEILHYVLYGYAHAEKRIIISLEGEGAEAYITGVLIGQRGTCALHTVQRHVAPHTTSDLLVKTALREAAAFQFHGEITIEKNAQHANAYQRNENIMLSAGARVDTRPELEILANDVRCTHGATVGKLDEEALFYLRARGLPRDTAESLALTGFLSSALRRIPDEHIQKQVHEYIQQQFQNT